MIRLNGWAISLDRKESGATVDFVSHAHSDHISSAKSSKNILASAETIELLGAVHNIKDKPVQEPHHDMRMLDAGHMLGSKQILVNDQSLGKSIVYTGDFQMQKSRACRPLEVAGADIAIVDSTYYDPAVEFDDRTETEATLQMWAEQKLSSGIVMFGAYALGKSQELIAILNEVGIVPVVTKKIAAACRVYKANGVRLDYASEDEDYDDYQQLRRGNFATIVESHSLTLERTNYTGIFGKHVYTGVATGMSKTMNFNTDVQFALSDHADFRQVKDYIDATGASTVYTYGGNAAHLADSLSRSGCSAVPFAKGGEITQEMLAKSVI